MANSDKKDNLEIPDKWNKSDIVDKTDIKDISGIKYILVDFGQSGHYG